LTLMSIWDSQLKIPTTAGLLSSSPSKLETPTHTKHTTQPFFFFFGHMWLMLGSLQRFKEEGDFTYWVKIPVCTGLKGLTDLQKIETRFPVLPALTDNGFQQAYRTVRPGSGGYDVQGP
jgi:hypothetical protein